MLGYVDQSDFGSGAKSNLNHGPNAGLEAHPVRSMFYDSPAGHFGGRGSRRGVANRVLRRTVPHPTPSPTGS